MGGYAVQYSTGTMGVKQARIKLLLAEYATHYSSVIETYCRSEHIFTCGFNLLYSDTTPIVLKLVLFIIHSITAVLPLCN